MSAVVGSEVFKSRGVDIKPGDFILSRKSDKDKWTKFIFSKLNASKTQCVLTCTIGGFTCIIQAAVDKCLPYEIYKNFEHTTIDIPEFVDKDPVLVRDGINKVWELKSFHSTLIFDGKINYRTYISPATFDTWKMCIPYVGNESYVMTTKNPEPYNGTNSKTN